jgi:hypothetical protein
MEASGLFYVRFMDDVLVLAPTRSRLRAAVRAGFDFLGYHFGVGALTLAGAVIERFVVQATLLYEQGRRARVKAPLLGTYVRRWRGWARAGMASIGADCAETLSQSIVQALGHIPVSGTRAA